MEILAVLSFFAFGTIIGSFLNVVILRYNTGEGVNGRSRCFSCGKEIKWYDLIPVLSFIFLGGKCRFCKSKISSQYALVEFFTGMLFVSVFWKFVPVIWLTNATTIEYLSFLVTLAVMAVLVVITVYDFKHKIIPDFFAILFSILAIVQIFLTVPTSILFDYPAFLTYFLAGPIIALPLFLLWVISRGAWIGLGDSKLALGIGWFLGIAYGVSALVIGFWIGAVVSLFLLALSRLSKSGLIRGSHLSEGVKGLKMVSEIPLAPFLILGFMAVYFFRIDVMGLSTLITR